MKKILFSIIALIGLLTSCSNDDIIVQRNTVIKINPSNVIAPFNVEIEAGELQSFPSSHKLRVRLLVYNEDGVLVSTDTQYLTNYAALATCNVELEKGYYDIVAITDVVQYSNSGDVTFEYWKLVDENNLLTTKMVDAGYIGGQYKIMGVDRMQVNVDFENSDIILYPQPVGALCLVQWFNIHTFDNSGITEYTLSMNRSSDFLQFNNSTGWDVTPENNNNQYDWRLTYINPKDMEEYNHAYNYYYCLPMSVSFKYEYTVGDTQKDLGNSELVNLLPGKEYWFFLDLNDEGKISYGLGLLLNGNTRASAPSPMLEKPFSSQSVFIKDINNSKMNK